MSGATSFDYVRQRYGVPARRGARVIANGKPGRITSGYGHYIRVLIDGDKHSSIWHPTWEMVYLDSTPATAPDGASQNPVSPSPGAYEDEQKKDFGGKQSLPCGDGS